MALLCCSLSAWAAPPACGPGARDSFTFEWIPKDAADPSIGSVRVKSASGRVVQVLDGLESYRGDSSSLRTREDYNNDGCPDLVLASSVGGIGNEGLTVFLYDPAARRFRHSRALSDIGGLTLDPRDRNCVTGSWKMGADRFRGSRHCWLGGRLVLTEEYTVAPLLKENGELKCYEQVTTEYRGRRKHERRECTSKL